MRLGVACIFLLILGTASVARAQDKAAARQAYLEGSKYYDLNQFDQALEAFKRAYWNYEEPVFLYNIAQCLRALKRKPEALDFYRSYLRKAPNATNRAEVQRLIGEMEQAVAQEKAVTTGPPQGTLAETKPAAPPPEKPATPAAPPPTTSSSTEQTLTSAPPPPRDKPAWKKPWVWGVVAGAVVVAGVAITVGIIESPRDPSPSIGALKVN
jgi:hypothetical protein